LENFRSFGKGPCLYCCKEIVIFSWPLFLGIATTDLLVLGTATILTIVVIAFALISKRKGKAEEVQLY